MIHEIFQRNLFYGEKWLKEGIAWIDYLITDYSGEIVAPAKSIWRKIVSEKYFVREEVVFAEGFTIRVFHQPTTKKRLGYYQVEVYTELKNYKTHPFYTDILSFMDIKNKEDSKDFMKYILLIGEDEREGVWDCFGGSEGKYNKP